MTRQAITQRVDDTINVVGDTVFYVSNKLKTDIDLVAQACASHDQILARLVEELVALRTTTTQLQWRIKQLEKRGSQ